MNKSILVATGIFAAFASFVFFQVAFDLLRQGNYGGGLVLLVTGGCISFTSGWTIAEGFDK